MGVLLFNKNKKFRGFYKQNFEDFQNVGSKFKDFSHLVYILYIFRKENIYSKELNNIILEKRRYILRTSYVLDMKGEERTVVRFVIILLLHILLIIIFSFFFQFEFFLFFILHLPMIMHFFFAPFMVTIF